MRPAAVKRVLKSSFREIVRECVQVKGREGHARCERMKVGGMGASRVRKVRGREGERGRRGREAREEARRGEEEERRRARGRSWRLAPIRVKIEDIDGLTNTIKRRLEGVQGGYAAFHGQRGEVGSNPVQPCLQRQRQGQRQVGGIILPKYNSSVRLNRIGETCQS